MSDKLEILDVSNGEFKPEDWKVGSKAFALKIAKWLYDQGATVAISLTHDGVVMLDYAWDGQIWPALRITHEDRMIWPKGSPFELQMKFLSGE